MSTRKVAAYALPLSKVCIYQIDPWQARDIRNSLKRVARITTVPQFLAATGTAGGIRDLEKKLRASGLRTDASTATSTFDLLNLFRRHCRLALVNGIGEGFRILLFAHDSMFCLEDLKNADPVELHAALLTKNRQSQGTHRTCRRSPTIDEVRDWIRQASDILASEGKHRLVESSKSDD